MLVLFNAHYKPVKRPIGCSTYCYSRHAKSSSKSSRSSTTTGRKVRSISELVKLVISGEVQVPKTLGHYVEEREELLDQVFTVLSENDIRGMLPDILKARPS